MSRLAVLCLSPVASQASCAPVVLEETANEKVGEEGQPEPVYPEGDERQLSYEEEGQRRKDHR